MNARATSEATVPTVQELYEALCAALKRFGEHEFQDKGPSDVVDVYGLGTRLEKASPAEAARTLRGLAHSGPNAAFRETFSMRLAGAFVIGMQEWDELFEQAGVVNLLNNRMPELQPGDSPVQEIEPKASRRNRPR